MAHRRRASPHIAAAGRLARRHRAGDADGGGRHPHVASHPIASHRGRLPGLGRLRRVHAAAAADQQADRAHRPRHPAGVRCRDDHDQHPQQCAPWPHRPAVDRGVPGRQDGPRRAARPGPAAAPGQPAGTAATTHPGRCILFTRGGRWRFRVDAAPARWHHDTAGLPVCPVPGQGAPGSLCAHRRQAGAGGAAGRGRLRHHDVVDVDPDRAVHVPRRADQTRAALPAGGGQLHQGVGIMLRPVLRGSTGGPPPRQIDALPRHALVRRVGSA